MHAVSILVSCAHLEKEKLSVVEAEKTKWTNQSSKNFQIKVKIGPHNIKYMAYSEVLIIFWVMSLK